MNLSFFAAAAGCDQVTVKIVVIISPTANK